MESFLPKLNTLLSLLGFADAKVTLDEEHRKISIIIDDDTVRSQLPVVLPAFDHLVNIMLHRDGMLSCVVDINFYRKERERLITELARAAAHKAMISKKEVELPAMNAYERRLVHVEITTHPSLKTESMGLGRDRHVVIKHLD